MSGIRIEADGHEIEISHPDKLLFPEDGIAKADIARYYARIAGTALPHFTGRPLTMQRFPDGIGAQGFFQKNASGHFPDWIARAEMAKEDGTVSHVVVDSAATLVYLADQGMIAPHVALSRIDKPDRPDRMVFDLDPPVDDFAMVQAAASDFRKLFAAASIPSFVQITGSRGMHVVVALDRSAAFDEVRDFARALADRLARDNPDRMTTQQRKAKRGDRLFLDTGRNAYAQTMIAPYGLRALPGAPLATPLDWDEALSGAMTARRYTIGNIFRRLAAKKDPWAGIDSCAVSLSAMRSALAARV